MRTGALRLGIALVLVMSTVAYATLRADGGGHPGASAAYAKHAQRVTPHGKIERLYPGATTHLRVHVRNTHRRAFRLHSVRAKVRGAGAGCAASNLRTQPKRRTDIRIPPHSKHIVKVKVTMRKSAADACQGAKWPLRFKTRGRGL